MSPKRILHFMEDMGSWARAMTEVTWQKGYGYGTDHLTHRLREGDQRMVARLHPKSMKLQVEEVIQETPTTKTFRFTRTDGELPPFRPGHYVNLLVTIGDVRTSRPYSISSAPGEAHLDLTVREKPGGFVSPFLLSSLHAGDQLESTGPKGHFCHEPLIDGDHLVLLAGGSGVTPFASMIRDQARKGFPLRLSLLYGSRVVDDVIFGEELSALADLHERFDYSLVISEPPKGYDGVSGFLDADRVRALAGEPGGKTYFVCGPNVMMAYCLEALDQLGAPRFKVRTESFGAPEEITACPGWPGDVDADTRFTMEVEGHGPVSVRAGESLMSSLERAGIVVPTVCRTGACSACRARLVEGDLFMPDLPGLREVDRQAGYVHLCMTYPLSDLKVRLYGAK